jgi:hypothetical protein
MTQNDASGIMPLSAGAAVKLTAAYVALGAFCLCLAGFVDQSLVFWLPAGLALAAVVTRSGRAAREGTSSTIRTVGFEWVIGGGPCTLAAIFFARPMLRRRY